MIVALKVAKTFLEPLPGLASSSSCCKRAGYKTHNAGHVCFKLYLLD